MALSPEQFAGEREVVIEERLASSEDNVDGLLDEMLYGQAFVTHPYRFPIVGRMADIQALTTSDVEAFYARHYRPDQAIVVVAGRFDVPAAVNAIAAAYGRIPGADHAAAELAPSDVPATAATATARAAIERPVIAARFVIGHIAPALGHADRAAFELLDEVLAGGPSSRLARLLIVERELASSVDGDVAPTRDPGLWSLWVQMREGHRAAEAESLIARELGRVMADPVPAAELDAARSRVETAFWRDIASSHGRAERLGHFEVATGDYRNLIARGAAYDTVTATDVQRVARAYLTGGPRAVVVARPKGGTP